MVMRKRSRKALRMRQAEAPQNGNGLSPSTNPIVARLKPLDPRDVAEILGVSIQTLATWRWKRKHPELRPITRFGRVRYPVQAVEDFLRAGPPNK